MSLMQILHDPAYAKWAHEHLQAGHHPSTWGDGPTQGPMQNVMGGPAPFDPTQAEGQNGVFSVQPGSYQAPQAQPDTSAPTGVLGNQAPQPASDLDYVEDPRVQANFDRASDLITKAYGQKPPNKPGLSLLQGVVGLGLAALDHNSRDQVVPGFLSGVQGQNDTDYANKLQAFQDERQGLLGGAQAATNQAQHELATGADIYGKRLGFAGKTGAAATAAASRETVQRIRSQSYLEGIMAKGLTATQDTLLKGISSGQLPPEQARTFYNALVSEPNSPFAGQKPEDLAAAYLAKPGRQILQEAQAGNQTAQAGLAGSRTAGQDLNNQYLKGSMADRLKLAAQNVQKALAQTGQANAEAGLSGARAALLTKQVGNFDAEFQGRAAERQARIDKLERDAYAAGNSLKTAQQLRLAYDSAAKLVGAQKAAILKRYPSALPNPNADPDSQESDDANRLKILDAQQATYQKKIDAVAGALSAAPPAFSQQGSLPPVAPVNPLQGGIGANFQITPKPLGGASNAAAKASQGKGFQPTNAAEATEYANAQSAIAKYKGNAKAQQAIMQAFQKNIAAMRAK